MKADLLIAKVNYLFRIILLIIMLLVFTSGIVSGNSAFLTPHKSLPDKTKVNFNITKPDGWIDFNTTIYHVIKQGYNNKTIPDIYNHPGEINIPFVYKSAILSTQTEFNITRKKKYIRATHLQCKRSRIATSQVSVQVGKTKKTVIT